MIRITKITDHGIVLLTHFARSPRGTVLNARDLAGREGMSLPMVSKILKILAGSTLLDSHRGVKGGYSLTREPEVVTLSEIVAALEGPIALTDCSEDGEGGCAREPICNVGGHWKIINRIILESMQGVTLAQLSKPVRDDGATDHDEAAAGGDGAAPKSPTAQQPTPDSAPSA